MAKPRRRGNSYQLRVTIDGITMSDTWKIPAGMTKKQAEKQAQKEQDKFEEEKQKGINPGRLTFAEVAQQYIDFITDTLKPTTVRCHEERLRLINQFLGHIKIKSLNAQHIDSLVEKLQKPYTTPRGIVKQRSAVTVNDYYKTGSCVCTFAVQRKYIENNPFLGKAVRKPRQTSDEDKNVPTDVIEAYAAAMENAPLQDRLFFHLTLNTGMRKGEVLGLSWDNVDLKNNTVTIIDNAQYLAGQGIIYQTTKRKASDRTLSIPAYVADMLREMKRQQTENRLKAGQLWKANPEHPEEKYCENHAACQRPCTGFCNKNCKMYKAGNRVFVNPLGHPISPYTPLKNMQKIGRRAGLPKISVHQLRHFAASMFIMDGNSIPAVSAFLGHSSPRTTMAIYAHAVKKSEQARSMNNSISSMLKIAE